MNERKLRIFYEVAEKLNMTEVAEKLYISQPAVSQTILELENELGVKLFDRINRRLYLTNEGEIFLNYVRRILNMYDDSIRSLKDINNLKTGKLKIGASTTIGIYILPDIIGKFSKEYKGIDISIAIENTKLISNMILDNSIDLAFVEGPVYNEEIIKENFCDDELVFITSSEHQWSNKDYISIDEIQKEKIIMREMGSGTREVFESYMTSNNVNYNIAFELGNTEAIKKAVEAGLGISCISKRCIKNELNNNKLSQTKLKEFQIKRNFILIYHKDKFLSKLLKTFIKFALENA
ncbi:selenium metabolism-associated LysR family transcriptional regulator [Clostridium tepidum]|jgi:DNA-binding transcriptional LysR family regulator|uniref:LysR family transcriptional regulator n=1 Tax=Clostridium tepidum TaxID=1962263 RepID=A0A1S9IGU3_9CLOT|nr:selenium metabolism-associated LysR family transcriptional regulator [Clostridium tepidum]MCR1934906.1 selenium metabolism-associated LysR family transcriptional regulator [Clostridium tepidum]MDU6878739.1 selenium metabolism-associated LysR family transcriptional regulator [Clostridium botulinum]OOO61843.1 LysR family transcriptional regulator [Clostridium tepidum]OOO69463.1 LysR family transcriptional regulator [Clostridium tepidum]